MVVRIARSEMGQGSLTGLAQLVAEELECDWLKVTTEFPTPGQNAARNRVWGSFNTGGSIGIRGSQQYIRTAGAAARMMLVQAAANEWKVAVAECTASNGIITHEPSQRTIYFGKVAHAAAQLEPPTDVKLKDPKDWKIAGKPVKRLDTADKVTGKMIYGIDLILPQMLNAAIKACPVFGGKLKSFETTKAMSMKGVKAYCEWAITRSPSLPTHGGMPRPRWMRCRSSGTRAITSRFRAARSQSGLVRDSTIRSLHSSATRRAT